MPRHQYKEQVILYSIFLLTLALPSCSSPQSFKLANTAVQEFHNKYNNEQYLEIYKQSDEMFREKGEAEAVAFFRKIGEKLGTYLDAFFLEAAKEGAKGLLKLSYWWLLLDALTKAAQSVFNWLH